MNDSYLLLSRLQRFLNSVTAMYYSCGKWKMLRSDMSGGARLEKGDHISLVKMLDDSSLDIFVSLA
jgi:hypothetical protein